MPRPYSMLIAPTPCRLSVPRLEGDARALVMPLIMMCGFPSSGKTRAAEQLANHLSQNCDMKVVLINEESLMLDRNVAFRDSNEEKNTRGLFKAAVDRHLSTNTIVICDSMNYIKGFRYQLYCTARTAGTPSCVVYCDVPAETARAWNSEKANSVDPNGNKPNTWSQQLLDELIMRFEVPNETRRWESPTFIVSSEGSVPLEQVTNYLLVKYSSAVNMATVPTKISDTNYLHEIDKVTQEILKTLLQKQGESIVGGKIQVPHASKSVIFARMMTMAELQRHRRTFLSLSRQLSALSSSSRDGIDYGDQTDKQIADSFVDYLNANLNN